MFMMCLPLLVWADNQQPITEAQLPAVARKFIQNHFPKANVMVATQETEMFGKTYEVLLDTGVKMEFDSKGNWKELQTKQGALPTTVVPLEVQRYIKQYFPRQNVQCLERDRTNIDVQLDNGVEITFDKNYRVVEID